MRFYSSTVFFKEIVVYNLGFMRTMHSISRAQLTQYFLSWHKMCFSYENTTFVNCSFVCWKWTETVHV